MSERWIVEEYGHTDWSDYPTWMPFKGSPYYATEPEAVEARQVIVDANHQRYVAAREKDVRECAERAAVYQAANAAVAGMPQAHAIGRGYRTEPLREQERSVFDKRYRVARVTSFQERVQALIDSTSGDFVDRDDLMACFEEGTA